MRINKTEAIYSRKNKKVVQGRKCKQSTQQKVMSAKEMRTLASKVNNIFKVNNGVTEQLTINYINKMGMREKLVRESKSSSTKTRSQEIRQMNPKWHCIYYLEIENEIPAAEVVTPGEQDKRLGERPGGLLCLFQAL